MNIVLFTEIFDCGGIDTFIINLIQNWPEKNDRFILIANEDYPGLIVIKDKLKDKVEIQIYQLSSFLNPFEKKTLFKKIVYPFVKYLKLFYNIFLLKSILSNKQFDFLIVVNGGYPGGDLCRSAAIAWSLYRKDKPKSVHNFHNLIARPSFFVLIQEYILDKLIYNSTSFFTTVSKAAKNSAKNRHNLKQHKIQYIYNGVQTNDTEIVINLRNELNLQTNIQICLMLATYEERKGHLFLLNAFNLVYQNNPNVRLVICGYGSDSEILKVKKYITELKLESSVYIYNFRIDKENLLRSADLILISSQEFESFGLTAIEAMSFKKPIVSTNIGGLLEVIGNDYGGFCLPKDDYYQFAEKITLLLKDKHIYDKMALRGYNRYLEFFTPDKMSYSYYKLINEITNQFTTKRN